MLTSAVLLVGGLGATTCAAATRTTGARWLLALMFAGGWVFIGRLGVPDPSWIGTGAVGVAALVVGAPDRVSRWVAAAAGGALGAVWTVALHEYGVPHPVAFAVAGGVLATAMTLTVTRSSFAPRALREEALVAVGALGILVAVGPTLADGWGTARVLNLQSVTTDRAALGIWVLVLMGTSAVGGAWHSLRRRW